MQHCWATKRRKCIPPWWAVAPSVESESVNAKQKGILSATLGRATTSFLVMSQACKVQSVVGSKGLQ